MDGSYDFLRFRERHRQLLEMRSKREVRRPRFAMVWLVAVSGCGDQVVDATAKMDGGAGQPSSGGSTGTGGRGMIGGAGGSSAGGARSADSGVDAPVSTMACKNPVFVTSD